MKIVDIHTADGEIFLTIEDDQGYTIDIMVPEDKTHWSAPNASKPRELYGLNLVFTGHYE